VDGDIPAFYDVLQETISLVLSLAYYVVRLLAFGGLSSWAFLSSESQLLVRIVLKVLPTETMK
jgi:hypothetical protein